MSEPIKFNILKHAGLTVPYEQGATIFQKGDIGNVMYVVANGVVGISLDGKIVDTLSEGEIFGEMALIQREIRSADAIAQTDCEVVKIDEKRFLFLTENTPMFALQVMRLMASRLRARLAEMQTTTE